MDRGGHAARVTFDEVLVVINEPNQDFVALDDALEALATFDERKSRVIELRVLRRAGLRRNGRRAEGLSRHGDARLAVGKGVAAAGDAR